VINFFKLYPSRIYSALLLIAYALAILTGFVVVMEIWPGVLLALLLLCALVYYLCRDVWLLLPSSYTKIRAENGNMVLLTRDGCEISGQLARDSLVTPVLTILNILPAEKQRVRSVVIFSDSMDKEQFRELRVLLKWNSDLA